VEHGAAVLDETAPGQEITFDRDASGAKRSICKDHLQRIMAARLEETFQLIADDIDRAGLLNYLGSGVFLCGGGARIPRIAELATQAFGLPVSLGRTNSINGNKAVLDHPEFATAIGLVRFGSFQQSKPAPRNPLAQTVKNTLSGLFRRS